MNSTSLLTPYSMSNWRISSAVKLASRVFLIEDVSDKEGDLGRTTRTLKDCQIFDDSNWDCTPTFVEGQGVVDHAQMRDGKLTHQVLEGRSTYRAGRRP